MDEKKLVFIVHNIPKFIRDMDREQFDCHGHCYCTQLYTHFIVLIAIFFANVLPSSSSYPSDIYSQLFCSHFIHICTLLFIYKQNKTEPRRRELGTFRSILHTYYIFLVCEYMHIFTATRRTEVINA